MRNMLSRLKFPLLVLLLLPLNEAHAGKQKAAEGIELSIPEDFDVLYVDGKKHPRKFFVSGDTTLSMAPGEHRVVVKYSRIFESGDNFDSVKSEPFMVTMVLKAQERYRLDYPRPKSVEAAKTFARNPQVSLIAMENTAATETHTVEITLSKQMEQQGWLDQFARKSSTPSDAAAAPSDMAVANPKASNIKAANSNAANSKANEQNIGNKPDTTAEGNAAIQLRYWWEKATQQERQDFLKAINPPAQP